MSPNESSQKKSNSCVKYSIRLTTDKNFSDGGELDIVDSEPNPFGVAPAF